MFSFNIRAITTRNLVYNMIQVFLFFPFGADLLRASFHFSLLLSLFNFLSQTRIIKEREMKAGFTPERERERDEPTCRWNNSWGKENEPGPLLRQSSKPLWGFVPNLQPMNCSQIRLWEHVSSNHSILISWRWSSSFMYIFPLYVTSTYHAPITFFGLLIYFVKLGLTWVSVISLKRFMCEFSSILHCNSDWG